MKVAAYSIQEVVMVHNRQVVACNGKKIVRKEQDLEGEVMSMEWARVAQMDWAHGAQIHQPDDVLVCVWYVHLCCESAGDSMGTQWPVAQD